MYALPEARDTGLSHSVGRPSAPEMLTGTLIAAACAILLCGGAGLLALIIASAVAAGMGAMAKTKIGGQTGDILGATQQLSEIAVLLSLLA